MADYPIAAEKRLMKLATNNQGTNNFYMTSD